MLRLSRIVLFVVALSLLSSFVGTQSPTDPPTAAGIALDDYRLASMGRDVSPREESKRQGTGNWASPVGVPGIVNNHPRIYPVGKNTWFVTNDNDSSSAWGWGTGRRTKDGGQTWSAPGDPGVGGGGVIHYAVDKNGRLWALWHDGGSTFTRTKLSYSDDAGSTWSAPVLTIGNGTSQQVRGWKVLVHPANANTIAVIGFSFGYWSGTSPDGWIAHSLDRGGSWTVRRVSLIREGQTGVRYLYDAVLLSSNRIVFQGPLNTGTPVLWSTRYTDDFGSNVVTAWSVSNSNARVNGLFWKDNRVAFFYTLDIAANPQQHRLMLSTDSGASFSQVTLAQELESYVNANFSLTRFAALPEVDAIYLATRTGFNPGTKIVVRLSPVDSSGTWSDLTANHPHTQFGNDNIAVIPEAVELSDTYGPVFLPTGNFNHQAVDVDIPGRGFPLQFVRTYNSLDGAATRLGYGWQDNMNVRLTFNDAAHSAADVTVIAEFGSSADFLRQSDGSYRAPAGIFDILTRNPANGEFELKRPNQMIWRFDGNGVLLSVRDRNNNTTTFTYTSGKLTNVTDPGGRSLAFNYANPTLPDRITKITDPLNRSVEFTYNASGDLTRVKDVKGGFTDYTYSNHRMTSITDANAHLALQIWYDTAGRMTQLQDAVGGTTCIYHGTLPSYTSAACAGASPSPASNETVTVDPRGYKTTQVYNGSYRPVDLKDPWTPSGIVHYDYDSNHNVTCLTDQRGKKTRMAYDTPGNITELVDASNTAGNCQLKSGGVKWTFTYTSNNDVDLETDPLGRQIDYVYDSTGNLTRIVRKDLAGAVKALMCLELDSGGQTTATVQSSNLVLPPGPTDACTGNRALYGYDAYGNVTCIVNARFTATTTCASDPGKKKSFIYDLGGRMLYLTDEITNNIRPVRGAAPETGATQCGTAGTGNGVNDDSADDAVADDGCGSWKYAYDAQNKQLTTMDPLGNIIENGYDAMGNPTSGKDPNRQAVGAGPETGTGQCGTYLAGNGVDDDGDSAVDDGCLSLVYQYDNADRLQNVIEAAFSPAQPNPVTTYSYDANSNPTTITRPKRQPVGVAESGSQCGTTGTGNDTDEDGDGTKDDGCPSAISAYDALNRVQSMTDALSFAESYQYDAASNLTQRTDARGLVTKYFPDDLSRLDLVEHWNGTTLVDSIDYTYNAVGFRTQMVDPAGTTTYTPDSLDRISDVTFPGPKIVSYTYDDIPGGPPAEYPGQRTKITYPDNKTVSYTYENDGRMKSVTDWLSRQTTYTYDDAGRLLMAQLPNTVWTDYGYDTANRLTSVANKKTGPITISSFTYSLDAAGNRTQVVTASGTQSYQYDALHRLTQATYPGPVTDAYTYDAHGNRLTKNGTTYQYDAADRMTTAGGVSYGYDNNGNQTSGGADTFGYDHEDRLTQAVTTGTASSSAYNGDGLRMSHTVGGATTNYTWDVAAAMPVVLQDETNAYVYGLDLISATDSGGSQTYFLHDGLGSVTDLTDINANVTATYSYDVFGAIRTQTGSSSNHWLFTGEQRDSESNFYYLRARYYDPAIGRFLGRDPLGEGNGYSYVSNNPVNLTDPSGLSASLWEYLGIAEPSFGIVPPTGSVEEFLAWFDQYVDWLYNVFFPAIGRVARNVISAAGEFIGEALNAAIDLVQGVIDAIEKLPDALNDLIDFVDEVSEFIDTYWPCFNAALGITLLGLSLAGAPGVAAGIGTVAAAASIVRSTKAGDDRATAHTVLREGVKYDATFLGQMPGWSTRAQGFGMGWALGGVVISGGQCVAEI